MFIMDDKRLLGSHCPVDERGTYHVPCLVSFKYPGLFLLLVLEGDSTA